MTYRVIQWATGNVGRAAIEGVLAHPELALVGTWVHSAEKDGRDVGEICGTRPIGVTATTDADALLALDADCVVYSPVLANPGEVVRILRSGKNVVTPLGWFYPWATPRVGEVEAACREAGVTLHGTGIHPGGMTEKLPLVLSAFCRNVRAVRSEEYSDIRSYATDFVVREVMLFGKTPDQMAGSPMLRVLGDGFAQSIDMVAAALGFTLDPVKTATHEWAVASAPIDTPVGVIESGTVAAQRFSWHGTVDGRPVVSAAVNWLMGEEHLDPPWTFGPAGQRYDIEVDADPPVRISLHGVHPEQPEDGIERNPGIAATAMHCVNSIPAVCEAEPGIRTYLDLPLVAGRAAP